MTDVHELAQRGWELKNQIETLTAQLEAIKYELIGHFTEPGDKYEGFDFTASLKEGKTTTSWNCADREKTIVQDKLIAGGLMKRSKGDPYIEFRAKKQVAV